jgi:hypothetical protein
MNRTLDTKSPLLPALGQSMVSVIVVEALIEVEVSVPTIVSVYVPLDALVPDELSFEPVELLELPPQPDAAKPINARTRRALSMRMYRLRRRQPSSPAPRRPAIAKPAGAILDPEDGGVLLLRTVGFAPMIFRRPLPVPVTEEELEQSEEFV